ncbi:UV radiation resistance protein and autophagy-related subunit 14-domain-containing protein [Hyaloraphidium curvatum]|nr:UV radiation resistance protein and autophagy-related subunit 14-domain-containing protein [Hyaloraphidium curvatum]
MECPACRVRAQRWVCQKCLATTLASHGQLYASREEARDRTAKRIEERLSSEGTDRRRRVDAALGDTRELLDAVDRAVDEAKDEIQKLQHAVATLKASNAARRQQLKQQRSAVNLARATAVAEHDKKMLELKERYNETAEVLTQTRKVLVKELCSVFGLRRVRREVTGKADEGGAKEQPQSPTSDASGGSKEPARTGSPKEYTEDYRIVNVTFPTQGDFWNYSRDEFNTGLGYILHITILASRYLSVPLPFPFEHKGSKSFARAPYPASLETGQMPLHLSSQPNNYDLFLVGFTMVNYNLAYLAHTQGVRIHLADVTHSLRNLWQALHSPLLGRDSFPPRLMIPNATGTAAFYATLGNSFPLDFGKCIRGLATLRAGNGVPGAPNGGAGYSFGVGLGNAFLERLADDALLSRLKNNLVGSANGAWANGSAMFSSIGGGWSTLSKPEATEEVVGSARAAARADRPREEGKNRGKRKEEDEEKVPATESEAQGEGLLDPDDADWLVV